MSYRSVKRVLGETRLELKCLLLFAVCLLTLIGGSFWWYGGQTEKLVKEKAKNTGHHLVDAYLVQYHWTRYESKEKSSNQEPVDNWATKLQSQNYKARFISPDPNKPDLQPRDEFEVGLLEKFPPTRSLPQDSSDSGEAASRDSLKQDTPCVERIVPDANGEYQYQYFQPVYVTDRSCAICHDGSSLKAKLEGSGLQPPLSQQSPEEGQLIAVAKIEFPDTSQKALNQNRAIFLATAVLTVFLAMIASYAIVRYVIVKPLKHLRDVSEEISRGNMEARAEIHTADEFEEVGMAFNKMVRHLVSTQGELKQTNTALDEKVDELAQTNMRLYEMNRLKSDFLATMSHELRTPLNSIIGFSEVLDSIKSLDDKQRRYVQNIQKSGRVLLDMINDILDLAKIESGKMEVRLTDFRIDAVVHAQCDFFRPQTEKKNIDLEIDIQPDLPELFQDQSKVQQILSNLLSNAIKFTPEGGRIEVRASREEAEPANNGRHDSSDGDLLLVVADTGVGIAEEDQVAIFEKFRQGQAVMTHGDAITREYSGTGLGLSIVKELCKLLGGEISLESQIGRGSTFMVRLPWTCAGQAPMDATIQDNLEEMLRPWRQEVQRTLERPVPAAPGVNR